MHLKDAARHAPQQHTPGAPGHDAAYARHQASLNAAAQQLQWFAPQFMPYVNRLMDIARSFHGRIVSEVKKPFNEFNPREVVVRYPVADPATLESESQRYPELAWREKNYIQEALSIPLMHTGVNPHPIFLTIAPQIARIAKHRKDIAGRYAQQVRQDEEASLRIDDPYRAWAVGVLEKIAKEGIPETITVRDQRIQGANQVYVLQRPEPVTPAMEAAFELVLARISQIDPSEYAELRKDAIEEVKGKVVKGKLEIGNAPELMLEAKKAKDELDKDLADQQKELSILLVQEEAARQKRDEALMDLKSLDHDARLAGIKDEWRRIRKKAKKAWDRNVWEPTKQVRDQISEAILPAVIQEFGRDINREANRVGRRVNKELNRGIENVATKYAPWLKAVIPLLALIPGVGMLASWVFAAALASVEIAHTYRVKRDLDGKLRKLKNQVREQIKQYQDETDKILAEITRIKKERLGVFEQSEIERAKRSEVTGRTLLEIAAESKVTTLALGSAAILGAYGLTRKRGRRQWPLVAALGVAFLAYIRTRQLERDRFGPYDQCVAQTGDINACRKRWIMA